MRPSHPYSALSLGLALGALTACGDASDRIAGPTAATAPALAVAAGGVGPLTTAVNGGMCVDVSGGGTEPGTPVILWGCHGGTNQQWTYTAANEVRVYGTLCLDDPGAAGQDGDKLIVWTCHGGANQRWERTDAGELRGAASGKCVDLWGANAANGAEIALYGCHGGANQKWNLGAPTTAIVAAPAAPVAGSGASKVFAIVGNVPSVSAVEALGGNWAKYERDFRTYADIHWATEGTSWENDYYDRAMIYYVWWARTGNQTYLDRANALLVSYRDNYLYAGNFGVPAHWVQPDGLAIHYLLTGDERSRTAVGRLADPLTAPYYMQQIMNPNSYDIENRQQAKVLHAFTIAKYIGAPSQAGNDWNALAHDALNKILQSQAGDGAYRWPGNNQCGYNKPFMVGLLNDAMISYYNLVEPDARIVGSVRKAVDYMWNNDWNAGARAFVYLEGYCGGDGPSPASDLNNMISGGFAFVWRQTGDDGYRSRGDQVFEGGVTGSWLPVSKIFNQEYTNSFRYLGLRLQ